MAMSLLYALLGINDREEIDDQARRYALLSSSHPADKDKKLAVKYYESKPKEKREVRKALYDALYHILEGSDVNRDLSMAIGKALCNAISGNRLGGIQNEPEMIRLRDALKPIVTEAIDEIESPSPKQSNP